MVLDDQSGLDVTEAGTKKSLAMYVVRDPLDVPGIARLGPDPLADDFTIDRLREILEAEGRKQIKGVLRHQGTIAGIGNAYSDELLHAARMSPFKPANSLDDTEMETLYAAIRDVLGDAVERSRGLAASELKGEKKSNLAVHGRTGETCPVCGDVVREVSFADSSLQYCATCQTGGKPLADRRMSKLLKWSEDRVPTAAIDGVPDPLPEELSVLDVREPVRVGARPHRRRRAHPADGPAGAARRGVRRPDAGGLQGRRPVGPGGGVPPRAGLQRGQPRRRHARLVGGRPRHGERDRPAAQVV